MVLLNKTLIDLHRRMCLVTKNLAKYSKVSQKCSFASVQAFGLVVKRTEVLISTQHISKQC